MAPPSSVTVFSVAVRATGQGGDLMADLFNKLVMRRKGRAERCCLPRAGHLGAAHHPHSAFFFLFLSLQGMGEPVPQTNPSPSTFLPPGISGKGPGTGASEGPGGAFARMSDSIPPLPPPQQPPGEEDEEEWES